MYVIRRPATKSLKSQEFDLVSSDGEIVLETDDQAFLREVLLACLDPRFCVPGDEGVTLVARQYGRYTVEDFHSDMPRHTKGPAEFPQRGR